MLIFQLVVSITFFQREGLPPTRKNVPFFTLCQCVHVYQQKLEERREWYQGVYSTILPCSFTTDWPGITSRVIMVSRGPRTAPSSLYLEMSPSCQPHTPRGSLQCPHCPSSGDTINTSCDLLYTCFLAFRKSAWGAWGWKEHCKCSLCLNSSRGKEKGKWKERECKYDKMLLFEKIHIKAIWGFFELFLEIFWTSEMISK